MPTLFLYGELDVVGGVTAPQYAAHMPHSKVVMVPGAKHPCYLDDPARFHAEIIAFLRVHAAYADRHERQSLPSKVSLRLRRWLAWAVRAVLMRLWLAPRRSGWCSCVASAWQQRHRRACQMRALLDVHLGHRRGDAGWNGCHFRCRFRCHFRRRLWSGCGGVQQSAPESASVTGASRAGRSNTSLGVTGALGAVLAGTAFTVTWHVQTARLIAANRTGLGRLLGALADLAASSAFFSFATSTMDFCLRR